LKTSGENWGFPTVGTTFRSYVIPTARGVSAGKRPLTVATVPPTGRHPSIKPGCRSRNERTHPSPSRNWPGSPKRNSRCPLARLLLCPRFDMVRPYHQRWTRPLGPGNGTRRRWSSCRELFHYDSDLEKGNLITRLRVAGENAHLAAFTLQREMKTRMRAKAARGAAFPGCLAGSKACSTCHFCRSAKTHHFVQPSCPTV